MEKVRKVRQTIDPKGGAAAEAREPASSIAAATGAALRAREIASMAR
jgi:hypothetical protein